MIGKLAALATLAVIATSAPASAAVIISTAATQNLNCSDGTCVPTATRAVLNASDLQNDLSQFGNVRVMTTGNSVEANNIEVRAAFASPDSTSLTLDAHKAITVNAAVSIGAGTSELELQSDTLAASDTLSFGRKGHITFGSLSDIFGINGGIFTLVGSVQGLASAVAANPNGSYALANDYDASQDGSYSDSPITSTFNGTFEGLGHRISNLEIAYKTGNILPVGLFSEVGSSGTIRDIGLSNVNVSVESSYFAFVGALVGENLGLVLNAFAEGAVNGGDDEAAGGLISINSGTVTGSYANVAVSGASEMLGGLVGINSGTISTSFATGDVVDSGGFTEAGGLVSKFGDGTVTECYATGSVSGGSSGDYRIGGLIGFEFREFGSPMAQTSYSTGVVPGDPGHGKYAGGSIGFTSKQNVNTDLYWDTTTSGTNIGVGRGSATGVTPITSQQLQSGLPTGFSPKIWAEKASINNGFPYLIANPPPK